MSRTEVKRLVLPFEAVTTVYEGDSEVRVYLNEITGTFEVGKRFDTAGREEAVAYREATLLKTIRHDCVVPVSEATRVDGYEQGQRVIELIMPYYEQGSIFDCFQRGEAFSVGAAVRIIGDALRGVRELHEVHGYLHRDIKSPNVFVDGQRGLIGDLGVSAPMDQNGRVPMLDNPRLWTPPESYTRGEVDVRADLYQMGIVLLEAVSGPLPYADYLIDDMTHRLQRGHRPIVNRDLRPAVWVPRGLRRVIRKATSLHPEERYDTARQMLDALRAAPLVDWRRVVDEPDYKIWEGATPQRPDRRFRVAATQRKRDGAWTVTGQQCLNAWRRARPDMVTPQLDNDAVARLFDEMVAIATNR